MNLPKAGSTRTVSFTKNNYSVSSSNYKINVHFEFTKIKMQTHFNSRSQTLNNVKENTLQSYNEITQMKKAMLQHKNVLHNLLVWTMIFNENFFWSQNYLIHNWAKQRLGLVMSLIDIDATFKYHNTFVLEF